LSLAGFLGRFMQGRNHIQILIVIAAVSAAALSGIAGLATGARSWFGVAAMCGLAAAILALAVAWRLQRRITMLDCTFQQGERMRLLGQVAGGLAHQLRNGVAATKLALQLHTRSCAVEDDESLDSACRQLARVEADLARFLDLGRDDVPRRDCSVVEQIEEAVSLLRPRCRHADVQLCWEPPRGEPVVHGDPGRLGHIFVNLLTNAVDAAGPGGAVEVSAEQTAEGRCVVEVRDDGPGPDAVISGRLFQPFVTGKEQGIGLGLFVARQAAEAHGGRLDWRRERGRTCFRVELPASDRDAEERKGTAIPAGRN
jgi:signal transduction histidine kinase